MTRQFKKIIILLLVCFYVSHMHAQNESIITDRPDQTESAALTPIGYLQGEHGFAVNFLDFNNEYSIASTLMRYGINEYFELRMEIAPVINDANESEFGINPVSIGLKSKLITKENFALSLITHIQLSKIATKGLQTNYAAIATRLTAAHSINDWWNIGYNVGIEWDGFTPNPYYIYTITSGFSLGEHCGVFAEAYGNIFYSNPASDIIYDPLDQHFVDAGFTYSPNPDLQFDISGGTILQTGITDLFISTGVAYRFNTRKNK